MQPTGDHLAAWLRSALDEHERIALGVSDCDCRSYECQLAMIARRTVAAHREILDAYQDQQRRSEENSAKYVRLMKAPAHVKDAEGLTGVTTHGWELRGRLDALLHSVQSLASIYREYPGFDPSWIPEDPACIGILSSSLELGRCTTRQRSGSGGYRPRLRRLAESALWRSR